MARTKKSTTAKSTAKTKTRSKKQSTKSTSPKPVTKSVAKPVKQTQAVAEKTTRTIADRNSQLNTWSWLLGAMLLAGAVFVYTQGSDAFRSVTAGYATSDTLLNADGSTDIVPAIRSLFDVNMRLLIAAILGMSGVSYILRASVLRSAYERRLQHEHSLLRWVEYAGGLGFVAVALVVGVSDIASLISILLATAVAIRGWRSLESSNHGSSKINWSGMKVMVESTAIPGVLIAVALYAQNRYASLDISPQTWRAVAIVAIASVAQALAVRAYYTRPPAKRVYHNVEWTRMFIAFVTIAAVSVSIYGHLLAS